MKITKTIETPEGGVKFEGELDAEQLDLVITLGLAYLMSEGLLKMKDNVAEFHIQGNDTKQ